MTATAREQHQVAVGLANSGDYGAALRLLERAERASDGPDTTARILGTRAYIVARSGDVAAGAEICLAALAVDGISPETFAILAGQMGSLAEHAGNLAEAETWLTRGIDALETRSDALANLVMNRSVVHMQRRRLADAAADAQRATELFRARGDAADTAQALHNEGYIALLRGDLVEAMQLMARARPALAAMSPVAAGISDVDRAEVLRDAGLVTEAERILTRSAELFGTHRMPHDRAQAELNLARSLLLHDPVRAQRHAAAAQRRFRRQGNERWALRAEAVRLRGALDGWRAARDGEAAPGLVADAGAGPSDGAVAAGGSVSGPTGRRGGTAARRAPTAAVVAQVAGSLAAAGFGNDAAGLRLSAALSRLRRGLTDDVRVRIAPSASMEVRLLASEVQATRAAVRGQGARARRHAAAGLDALAQWRRDFGSLDLQTSTAMHGIGLLWTGLTSAVDAGRPEAVFEWSERARHHSIQIVPLRPPPDPALADDLAELRMLRADDQDALMGVRAAELQAAARQRQWAQTGSIQTEERATLDELRAELDPDTGYLGYVLSERGLTALVVTRSRVQLVPLPEWGAGSRAMAGLRADLDMAASVRTGPLARVVRASLHDRLAGLSRVLLDAPARAAGTRRLLVTAPGALAGIPWSMLPGMRGHAFTLAGSASRWVHRHRGTDAAPRSAGFAVGPRVPRGDEEVRIAAAAWRDARVLPAATVDEVAALAGDVDLLHIAAHGRHAVDNPLFSGLELADGALFGYDVDRIPRPPRTVVLSACEAGRSSVRWGEESIGMTRVWLHAGSLCVVAAPVVVADDDACELLAEMHGALAAGMPAADALAEASDRTGIVAPFQAHGAGF
ncbi:CHAT domain-containing protein [Microbacterium sp. CJ88]|uniref:CHAT domain-containing protein n=1 Tax=Microbacterium sp. CJ88 TaxID=3445672 RepID=UPI003F656903